MVTPRKLFQEISAGKFKPAFYFFGPEDYRIVEAEKFVARKFLPDRQLVTNYRRMDGRRTPCADLVAELSSLPMLGDRQVITVTDFQSYKPTEVKRILAMLTPVDPNRIVIFNSPSSRTPNKKSRFFMTVSNAVVAVEFKRLTARDVSSRVVSELEKEDIHIDRQALDLLTQLISGNRGGFETEVDKLINYTEKGGTITVDDVKKVSVGYEVFNIFELADRIIDGQVKTVLKMINSLVAGGNNPVTIATLLQQHFICLYLVKNDKKPLDKRSWLVPKFREQAAHYETRRLEQILIEIARTDAEFRRQRIKQETGLEMLALNLTRKIS